jgi:pyruvate formate lyase activating enzyme
VIGHLINIQRYSINDGPGIRTTVFLKGCELRCRWCHNPESWSPDQEILFYPELCSRCGRCAAACPESAQVASAAERRYDRSLCRLCGRCVEACPSGALSCSRMSMEAGELMAIVRKDSDYYRNSGGGLTLSGGEPLCQREFALELFRMSKASGIDTALDTAANHPWAEIEPLLTYVDLLLLDLKCMDSALHRAATGTGNELILDNARRLSLWRGPAGRALELIVRIPVVPGVNATLKNMEATAEFLADFPGLRHVELLACHDLGKAKSAALGRAWAGEGGFPPTEQLMRELARPFTRLHISVKTE